MEADIGEWWLCLGNFNCYILRSKVQDLLGSKYTKRDGVKILESKVDHAERDSRLLNSMSENIS